MHVNKKLRIGEMSILRSETIDAFSQTHKKSGFQYDENMMMFNFLRITTGNTIIYEKYMPYSEIILRKYFTGLR